MLKELFKDIVLLSIRTLSWILYITKFSSENKILIVKIDAIGDYVLVRNYFEEIRKSQKFAGHQIHFVGNIVTKDLSCFLDSSLFIKTVWIDRKRISNWFDLLFQLRSILFEKYNYIINPTYSRDYYGDEIIRIIHSRNKIGMVGDLSNQNRKWKSFHDNKYTKLVSVPDELIMEFEINAGFFSDLLEISVKPKVEIDLKPKSPKKEYIVIGIGAGSVSKMWSETNFIELIDSFNEKFPSIEVWLVGGIGEKEVSKSIVNGVTINRHNVINTVGKTSLKELLPIIQNATLILSNDTSISHIAVAFKVPMIVLYKGDHFGRFHPYDSKVPNVRTIIPSALIELLEDSSYRKKQRSKLSEFEINNISVKDVQKEILNMIN